MPVTSLSPLISTKCYAADIFMFRLDRIGLFSCCFTKLIGKWMADYINFLSVALQINMVSCYELKRVGTGSVGSEEKGDAWIADSFSFLSNSLVMSFFLFHCNQNEKSKYCGIRLCCIFCHPCGPFKAVWEDRVQTGVWAGGVLSSLRTLLLSPPDASVFLLRAMLLRFKNMKNVSHWYFQML